MSQSAFNDTDTNHENTSHLQQKQLFEINLCGGPSDSTYSRVSRCSNIAQWSNHIIVPFICTFLSLLALFTLTSRFRCSAKVIRIAIRNRPKTESVSAADNEPSNLGTVHQKKEVFTCRAHIRDKSGTFSFFRGTHVAASEKAAVLRIE